MHVAFSLLTLDPGRVGGSETYARGLLAAYAAGAGPEQVTVLAGPRAGATLRGPTTGLEAARQSADPPRAAGGSPAGGRITVAEAAGLPLGGGRAGRLLGLVRGMAWPPEAARAAAATAELVHFPLTVPIPPAPGPSVLTLFDVLHHDVPDLFSSAERAFRRVAYDRAARHATQVITVSEHSRARMLDLLGLQPARVVAIHPGIDHDRFIPGPIPEDDALLAPLALPERPWLLYPAALWPHKNHTTLLEALAGGARDVSLVLTGAGFGRLPELRATALRAGVADRVQHVGFVADDTLSALYRAATGVVFPSLAEGFGQPPVEAMACGCPVAASDTGAVAEACGGAVLAFAPRDVAAMAAAIARLVADEPLRAELRGAGLERARAFTWERSAARHAEVYAAAVSSPAPR